MDSQAVIAAGHVLRLRELKDEISRLKEENDRLRDESASLRAHFDLAVLAATDLAALPPGGTFFLIDGWNLVLGNAGNGGGTVLGTSLSPLGERLLQWLAMRRESDAGWRSHSPHSLKNEVRGHLDEHPADFAWVIFDGHHENSTSENRLRISYTGGNGSQRADRLMLDFIKMARFTSRTENIVLISRDKDLLRNAKRCLNSRSRKS